MARHWIVICRGPHSINHHRRTLNLPALIDEAGDEPLASGIVCRQLDAKGVMEISDRIARASAGAVHGLL